MRFMVLMMIATLNELILRELLRIWMARGQLISGFPGTIRLLNACACARESPGIKIFNGLADCR